MKTIVYFTATHSGATAVIESDTVEKAKQIKQELRAAGITCSSGLMQSSFSIMTPGEQLRADYILSLLPA